MPELSILDVISIGSAVSTPLFDRSHEQQATILHLDRLLVDHLGGQIRGTEPKNEDVTPIDSHQQQATILTSIGSSRVTSTGKFAGLNRKTKV